MGILPLRRLAVGIDGLLDDSGIEFLVILTVCQHEQDIHDMGEVHDVCDEFVLHGKPEIETKQGLVLSSGVNLLPSIEPRCPSWSTVVFLEQANRFSECLAR